MKEADRKMKTATTEPGSWIAPLLTRNWKLLALRGLVSVVFGILAVVWPLITLVVMAYLFGAYALVNGILAFLIAYRAPKGYPRFSGLIFEGIFSVLAGALALLFPGITVLSLLILIAAWAIVTGVIEIVAAIQLRKEIRREWLLALAGLASIGLGVLLLLRPAAGLIAMALWIGAFSIAFGGPLLVLAFRMRATSTSKPAT